MKLCIQCKHLMPREGDPEYALARCGAFFTIHPVSGSKIYSYAYNQRMFSEGKCGLPAAFFDPLEVHTDE